LKTTSLRKSLKAKVAKTAEIFAVAVADCSVHGQGDSECACDTLAYQYDYLINELRATDKEDKKAGDKARIRRKKWSPIHAAPHFASTGLVDNAVQSYEKATRAKHEPEIIWDDECCCAMYCDTCKQWGTVTFDYLGNPEGAKVEGKLFEQECGV